jgi:hypothetical protein
MFKKGEQIGCIKTQVFRVYLGRSRRPPGGGGGSWTRAGIASSPAFEVCAGISAGDPAAGTSVSTFPRTPTYRPAHA